MPDHSITADSPAGARPLPVDTPSKPRARFELLAILSGIALAAFAARTAAQAQVMASAGVTTLWSPVLTIETANWLAWSLYAAALIPLVRRVVERPGSRAFGAGVLLALVMAPVVLIPLVASPVHWLGFGHGASLASSFQHMLGHNAPMNLLLGAAMVGVTNGYLGLQRARRLEVTAAQLHAALTSAQLEALRSQLNPHFLFNALNSIAVLARRGQTVPVEQMVTRLAGLLRHSLDSARTQEVPLRVELEALRHYLEIEMVRHGERLVAALEIPTELHEWLVPSFLLQPLVENAVRHGLTDPHRPLRITVSAHREPGALVLRVADDGAGLADREAPADGIGLGHTRARLAGLHGARASLQLGPGPDGRGACVTITLPAPAGTDG